MINVLVQIWIKTNVGRLPIMEKLIIDKQSLLPKGKGQPSLGRWTSNSKYLGRTSSGNYLLRNYNLETYGPDSGSLADPVGWFVDSADWDAPFLILSNFDEAKGIGKLRMDPPEPLPLPDSENVHWYHVG